MSCGRPTFHVRDASSAACDIEFIISAWDSTLPFLQSIGAGEMWSNQPFSQREGFTEDIADLVRKSEADPKSYSRRVLIAEAYAMEDEVTDRKPVGAVMLRDALPRYLTESADLKGEVVEAESFLFIEVLFVDHRDPRRSKGAGAALVRGVEARARDLGKTAVFVDSWAGNGRKLNR
ncbi:GNAT family protein [Teratosphaeria nubilosa]|uniref:GNAT family protein n=1 Tax=Teratosphaeria nubilosa TaxID=161662 RepID=A0A6G1L1W8_9PEZI|nr:GNAT family protein [Teratosphaeria nubilosa]